MDPGSLPGSWNPTPKQEQTKMHPKQHRLPVVPEGAADAPSHGETDPDLIRALFDQMTLSLKKDIKIEIKSEMSTLRSELVPRVAALEARTADEQTSPGHHRRDPAKRESSRGRLRDASQQRHRDKRDPSRERRRATSPQRRQSRDRNESSRSRRRDRYARDASRHDQQGRTEDETGYRSSRDKRAPSRSRRHERDHSRQRRRSRDASESGRSRRSRDASQRRRYDHDDDDYYGTSRDHRSKPRFRPDSLPQIWFGDDVAKWIAEMEHVILQHGEEIVCPEIFAHSFISGDAIKLWYMDLPVPTRKAMTTAPGCWTHFKEHMEHRFSVDVGLRQIEAEDRARYPNESYADFAFQKMYLIRRAFPNLASSAVISMVKRKLDLAAVSFCRERNSVDDFVTELMEFDHLQTMHAPQRPPPLATGPQRGLNQSYATPSAGNRDYGQTRRQTTQYQQQPAASYGQPVGKPSAPTPASGSGAVFVDPRLPTVQPRKHPQTGVETLSYLDRFGKAVFIQRPCGHCEAAGKRNAWHFEFSCANKPQAPKRARTYAGVAGLPGTVESPTGLPTSYTFSGQGDDPGNEENPFSIDDCDESGNGEWDQ
jgi:hypothetical protein